jgi:hypothetical protein
VVPKVGSATPGSRRAATSVRNDRGARPKTVEDHDRRSCHRQLLTWRFSRVFPGPQHHEVPSVKAQCRSRTEEVRGSNPLTSTPPSHQLRAHGAIRFRRPDRVARQSCSVVVPSLERFEENFQTGKGRTGLDQHQVRTWTSWYRWTTLVMLGHLLLVAATIIARAAPCPEGLIRLSLNETRRHLIRAIPPSQLSAADADAWSAGRRQHQHRAQQAH